MARALAYDSHERTGDAAPRGGGRASLVPAPNADFRTLFHPAVAAWFAKTFRAPTAAQAGAWPAIKAGRDTLIAAPTGSGKTLSAFLAALDDLVRQGLEGTLTDATQVVYVSPLKALSNDIHRNLDAPLAGIRSELKRRGLPDVDNPHLGPDRRHRRLRARAHASPAAAHPRRPRRNRSTSSSARNPAARCWRRPAR